MKRKKAEYSSKRKPLTPGLYWALVSNLKIKKSRGDKLTMIQFHIHAKGPNLYGMGFGDVYPLKTPF